MAKIKYLNIRVSDEELELLKQVAQREYMSLAQLSRKLIFSHLK